MATVNGSSTINGQGAATAAMLGIASTTTTIAGYLGDDAADYIPGFDLTTPHSKSSFSFADPALLAAVLQDNVVGRFPDEDQAPVQETLWASEDPDAPALLIQCRSRAQAQLLASGRNAYAAAGGLAPLMLIQLRMLLSA